MTAWPPVAAVGPVTKQPSLKGHTNSLFGPPSHIAGSARPVRLDGQIEGIGNPDAVRDLKARASLRQVADGAADHREPVIEHDPAGFQRPVMRMLSLLQHLAVSGGVPSLPFSLSQVWRSSVKP